MLMGLMVTLGGLQAAQLVTDNLPGLPGQSDAYWTERRKEQAEQQKRSQGQSVNLREVVVKQGVTYQENKPVCFYTGKPFDMELGTYVFKYRNYDPKMQRWTTADPSGFPDGANNYTYVSMPSSSLDPTGLVTIDNAADAVFWYKYGLGLVDGVAGNGLISTIKNSSGYLNSIVNGIAYGTAFDKLRDVSFYDTSGNITGGGDRSFDTGITSPVGGIVLNINYNSPWTSSEWVWGGDPWNSNGYRYVEVELTLNLSFTDLFDFSWNSQYGFWQNLGKEVLPSILIGNGIPYNISGSFTDVYVLHAQQIYVE